MKNTTFTRFFVYFILCLCAGTIHAQTIQLIPNLNTVDPGDQYSQIVYNSNLYFVYQDTSGHQRLAQYNGSTLSLIANPNSADIGVWRNPIVHSGNLYTGYINASHKNQLAKYNGSTVSLVSNPGINDLGYGGSPIEYNGNLYFQYLSVGGSTSYLAKYDGNSISLIANPNSADYGFSGEPILYNGNLYFQYQNASGNFQLAKYDGTAISLISNPDTTAYGYIDMPIVYNNKLYFGYQNASGIQQLAVYDGSTLNLVSNINSADPGFQISYASIIYNSKLYFVYKSNTLQKNQLAQYDGNTLSLIANPNNADAGFISNSVVYNGNLYFEYRNASGKNQLSKFDGTSVSLIANRNNLDLGFQSTPTVYNGKLYFQYLTALNFGHLAQYDGTSVSVLANPDSVNGSQVKINSDMVIFNNALYFNYWENQSGIYNLATLIGSSSCMPTSASVSANICSGSSYTVGTHTYSAQGTYYDTLTNIGGCDSIVTLHLSVNPLPTVTFTWDSLEHARYLVPYSSSTVAGYCQLFCPRTIVPLVGGMPAGGVYSGDRVTNDTLNLTYFNYATNYVDSVFYTYTDSNGCSVTLVDSIVPTFCDGLQALTTPNSISLYPNPNNGLFTLATYNLQPTTNTYTITDMLGNVIEQKTITTNTQIIDLNQAAEGVYTLAVNGAKPVRFVVVR